MDPPLLQQAICTLANHFILASFLADAHVVPLGRLLQLRYLWALYDTSLFRSVVGRLEAPPETKLLGQMSDLLALAF